MDDSSSTSASRSGALGAAGSALIMHSSDDDVDNPVLPVLVESDGQPSGLGRALWTLERRDGYDTALAALGRGGIWLRVTAGTGDDDTVPEEGPGQGLGQGPGQGIVVRGYGVQHPRDEVATLARIEEAMAGDDIWWYVVERHGMLVDYRRDGRRRNVSFVGWSDPEPTWADLDAAAADPTPR
jgi:hypothetical protein